MAKLSLKTRVDQFNNATANESIVAPRLLVETIKHGADHGDDSLLARLIAGSKKASAEKFIKFCTLFGITVKRTAKGRIEIEGLNRGYNGNQDFLDLERFVGEGQGWNKAAVKDAFPDVFPVKAKAENTGENNPNNMNDGDEEDTPDAPAVAPTVAPATDMARLMAQIKALTNIEKSALKAWLDAEVGKNAPADDAIVTEEAA